MVNHSIELLYNICTYSFVFCIGTRDSHLTRFGSVLVIGKESAIILFNFYKRFCHLMAHGVRSMLLRAKVMDGKVTNLPSNGRKEFLGRGKMRET